MTAVPSSPSFSVAEIPFSHHGSWFDISPVIAEKTYADDLHLVSHQTGLHPVLRLVPTDGDDRVDATVTATPALLSWVHGTGRVELAYENADTIRVRGRALGMRIVAANPTLTPFSGPYFFRDPVDGAYVFTLYETGRRYRITPIAGPPGAAPGTQELGSAERGLVFPADREWEVVIEEYETARPPYTPQAPFEEVARAAHDRFAAFTDAIAPWRSAATPAAELAAYVLWSATVRPAGFLARPGVLMSKHWMDKVWSWDHCFNAIALGEGAPGLAVDQFQLPFDHQDPAGALPDSVTHSEILYNFVKPPIHGWALHHLRERLPEDLDRDTLAQLYQRLVAWTDFWLTARRAPGQPLPHYQHGNDSGWDNATTFDPERVIQSADLAAFLVLQLRCLAVLAADLGEDDATWTAAADRLRGDLIDRLWDGDAFTARGVGTGRTWATSSLLDLMPIVLGEELPREVAAVLAGRIKAHLTDYGLATELPSSPHYQPDGYWRGPIWAPATVLIEDGLRRAGFTELADDVSARFRALCERSGFAENFDALTGAGLRDRAYTWTASGYLILAAAHERRRADAPPPTTAP
ncbi:glycogen debranching protein [Actinomadura rudentiformis]|uniref:Glycogen debranching protein n=1 Tax=Actinomadura rudentiformis TaxID=359158 RepID=A0A6H9YIH1_9ACTN|nr:glycogen debranching protein [Actinomadura rudentiformis]